MSVLVQDVGQLAENIRRLHSYSAGTEQERKFHRQTIKNGKLFVHLREKNLSLFAPSKFAGYVGNNLAVSRSAGRDGRDTNPHLDKLVGRHLDPGDPGYDSVDKQYLDYCRTHNIVPSVHHKPRRYWSVDLTTLPRPLYPSPNTEDNSWSNAELVAAVETYFEMLNLETAGQTYSKAKFVNELLAGRLARRNSVDHRMQNISFILKEMGHGWIRGYQPLPNVGRDAKVRLQNIIKHFLGTEGLVPTQRPVTRPGRKLPPTGYWMFVCRRGRWDGTVWLRSDSDETLYMVSESHKDEMQVGDLGVLRLNKLASKRGRLEQPAGVYAILEVAESPLLRHSDHEEGFSDPKDAGALRWRAKVRLLSNLVDTPVDAFSLPTTEDYRFFQRPLPQSTIPISPEAFHQIMKQSGADLAELREKRASSTIEGVRSLERKAVSLDPKRKERISRAIERGLIGGRVKEARKYRCQICEALGRDPIPFVKNGGIPYAEAHHVHPVSLMLAGSLADTNIMVLCPNHHRQAHFGRFSVEDHRENEWLVKLDDQPLTIPRTTLSI